MDHTAQLQRITEKLKAARKADRALKVFGADLHRYRIGPPASEQEVRAFEERYSIKLPDCYRAFVTVVGNGGPSWEGCAAGPYFGIFRIGDGVDAVQGPGVFLSQPAIFRPEMTDEEWADEIKRLDQQGLSRQDYGEELGRIFSGILPLGSQGCSYLHGLVLNGPHAGKVVNYSEELEKPKFTFERNFLDWYERWLDEIIAGYLTHRRSSCFGLTMGGDDLHLMQIHAGTEDRQTRLDALEGLAKLRTASDSTCRKLLELCSDSDAGLRHQALSMLCKFDYPMAREPLHKHLISDDDDCLAASQILRLYAASRTGEWAGLLRQRLSTVAMPETFGVIIYYLTGAGVDFSAEIRPFCTHPDEKIRTHAFYALGKMPGKRTQVDLFLMGLEDPSPSVVHATLQALEGVTDKRLDSAYHRVRSRFRTDEHYILTNLAHRERELRISYLGLFRYLFRR